MFNQATIDNLTLEEKIHFGLLPESIFDFVEEKVDEKMDDQQDEIKELEETIEKLEKKIEELEAIPPPQEKLL